MKKFVCVVLMSFFLTAPCFAQTTDEQVAALEQKISKLETGMDDLKMLLLTFADELALLNGKVSTLQNKSS